MKEKYLGYEIDIDIDESPEDPRSWDEVSTLVTAHRAYKCDEELPSDCADIDSAFEEHLSEEGLSLDEVYYHKVYLYEHSGVSVSTIPYGDRWDSGVWGYIYVSIEDAEQNFMSIKKDDLEKESLAYMNRQVETLNKYYGGEIYELYIPLLGETIGGYNSEAEALAEAKVYIDNADPKGKTMELANDIYEQCMTEFWDKFNNLKNEEDLSDNDEDLLTEIVGDELKKY